MLWLKTYYEQEDLDKALYFKFKFKFKTSPASWLWKEAGYLLLTSSKSDFCLGFPWATFREKSCKCSSQAERGRLIHIAATQSGGVFLVNKLRAVNLQLSKYKLIDGGSVSVTQKQVWVLTLMTGTVPTVSTGQDLRTKAPAQRQRHCSNQPCKLPSPLAIYVKCPCSVYT